MSGHFLLRLLGNGASLSTIVEDNAKSHGSPFTLKSGLLPTESTRWMSGGKQDFPCQKPGRGYEGTNDYVSSGELQHLREDRCMEIRNAEAGDTLPSRQGALVAFAA